MHKKARAFLAHSPRQRRIGASSLSKITHAEQFDVSITYADREKHQYGAS